MIRPNYLPIITLTYTDENDAETTVLCPTESVPIEQLLARAEEDGNDRGCMQELGERYLFGLGGAEQDYEKAFDCLKRAAEQGAQDALNLLADFYLDAERGIVKYDEKEHLRLRELAANSGSWSAMEKLARCYEAGRFGADVDHEKAFYWAKEAERMIRVYWDFYNQPQCRDFRSTYLLLIRAHLRVCFMLSHYCADGVGVKRDLNEAIVWLDRAEAFACAASGLKAVPVVQERKRELEKRIKKDKSRK